MATKKRNLTASESAAVENSKPSTVEQMNQLREDVLRIGGGLGKALSLVASQVQALSEKYDESYRLLCESHGGHKWE